ncbi:DEAD/DEAH box helicase [Acinetobacter nosocomialis]|uniref:DEAD/DEAH box helicase n=1 Tax=Acinetobacter nosocomialis TaxID=106654 RepID=UPI0024DEC9CA|nr:DEAD/DEAH box helicase [Acinetobacter nosocomialis]
MCVTHKVLLKKGQYLSSSDISSHITVVKGQNTLIEAGTGVGKTSMIMGMAGTISDHQHIIMVVPSVLKVQELESSHPSKYGKIKYLYFYDKKTPTEASFDKKQRYIIVCTYDKLDAVLAEFPQVDIKKSLLVVDECHKLYSAGSYRDEAINSLLFTLEKKRFPTVLFLTATFTPHCWDTLKSPLSSIYKVQSESEIQRSLELIMLKKGDQYSFIPLVIKRLEAMRETGQSKKILIRYNNRQKCELLAAMLEKYHHVKTMIVHSKNKNDENVQELFTSQIIPKDIDVIFCTSIMDEAININNLKDELDSVFIVGKDAHPEELVQFMGRLRKTAVPCFMVIHTEISENHHISLNTLRSTFMSKNKQFIDKLNKVAELLSEIFDEYQFDMISEEQQQMSIYKKVTLLNETFNELSGSKLFTVNKGKVQRNTASIAANYYRMDKGNCYENFYYLKARITDLLPTCTVKYSVDLTTETPQYIKEFLKEEKAANKQVYADCLESAFEIFLSTKPMSKKLSTQESLENNITNDVVMNLTSNDEQPTKPIIRKASYEDLLKDMESVKKPRQQSNIPTQRTNSTSQFKQKNSAKATQQKVLLKDYGVSLLDQSKNDEVFVDKLVAKYDVPHHAVTVDIVTKIAVLSTVIGNLEDIYNILQTNQYDKILTVAKAYSSNIVVQYLIKRFYRYSPERYIGKGYRLKPTDAAFLITDAFESIHKSTHIPMATFMKDKLVSGIKVDFKTKKVSIDPSKAANFIAKFFAASDRNAKKPELRFLEFQNIAYGNYQYLSIANIQQPFKSVPHEFQIGECIFNSLSGELISGPEISKSTHQYHDPDGIDVFEDDPVPLQLQQNIQLDEIA